MRQSSQPLVINGTDGSGSMIPGFDSPPYRVFDPDSEECLTGDIWGRRQAESVLNVIGKALNRPVCRELNANNTLTSLQRTLNFMRVKLRRAHGDCSTIPKSAITCAQDNQALENIYQMLLQQYGAQVEPMWILIKDGPYGRYTRFLMGPRSFFDRPPAFEDWHYWSSLPSHGAMITYLEVRGLCPWQR